MAIKVYGDKIVFPDSTEQTTAPTQLDGYDKAEMDAQQKEQNDKIQANTDAIEVNADAIQGNTDAINAHDSYTKDEVDAQQGAQDTVINTKVEEAPIDGTQYVRKDEEWFELDTTDEGILDAPADGKTYGRKDEEWTEVVVDAYTEGDTDALLDGKADKADTYTKAEIDEQQLEQDAEITANTTDIADNATAIEALVDDKADKTDTYTKAEIDVQQDIQDDAITVNTTNIATNTADIATNKSDIAANSAAIAGATTRVTENEHDIIELEEEIEALAPSFDRGHWTHDPVEGLAARAPIEGAYYLAGASTEIVQTFKDTHQIYFNNIDNEEPPHTHTFDDVTEGMYVEMFEATNASFFLGVVETVTKGDSHTVIDVTMVKSEGGPKEGDSSVRVKFFILAETELELDGYITRAEVNASQAAQDVLIQANADAIEAMPEAIDAYTKEEIDVQQTAQDTAIQANTDAIEGLPDIIDAYSKDEVDELQDIQDAVIDTKADKGDSYLKAEADTLLDNKADKETTYTKTEVDDSQALQDTEIAKKADKETTYTKAEVDASQKAQNDAIEAIAPTFPHGYVYVNNSVESSEEDKVWETFVPPKPGEMFFLAEYLAPVPDGNYASARQLFVSKYDNKGNELPFKTRDIYSDEGEFEFTFYDVFEKDLELVSPNGSATYRMEAVIPSTEAPEHIGYEGETFLVIAVNTYESKCDGTVDEGEIVQITSPEDGGIWKAKDYVHPDDSNYVITSANSKTNQIVVNKLAISSSYTGTGEDTAITNIVIGTEPSPEKPYYANEIMPGVNWNSGSKGNIAIGHRALKSAEDVNENVAVGQEALGALRNGWGNTAIGYEAGVNLRSGDNNIFIGYDAGPVGSTEDVRGQVVLGNRFANQLWVGDNKVFPFPDDLGGGGGVEEAPDDGKQYGRQDETWTEVDAYTKTEIDDSQEAQDLEIEKKIEDAPKDGKQYARKDEAWSEVAGGVWEEVGAGFGRAAVTQVYGLGIGTDYPYKPSGRTLQVEADGPTRLILNNTKANMMVIKADDPAVDSSNQGGGIVISDYTGTNEAGAEPIARFNSNGVFVEKDLSANRILVGSGNGNWTNTRIGSNTFKDMDDSAVHNTAVGRQALLSVTNGIDNVAVGSGALQRTREGSKNVGIGHEAGLNITTGINNTCIGYAAQPSDPKVSNEVTIGNDDVTATRLKGTVTANGTPLTTTVDVDTAIDKKLAIKDKLIEKLSARLDKLEKKLK